MQAKHREVKYVPTYLYNSYHSYQQQQSSASKFVFHHTEDNRATQPRMQGIPPHSVQQPQISSNAPQQQLRLHSPQIPPHQQQGQNSPEHESDSHLKNDTIGDNMVSDIEDNDITLAQIDASIEQGKIIAALFVDRQ